MMAAAAIQEGQVLLQVPETLFMTANTAVKSKLCGKLVKAAELPEWQVRSLAGQTLYKAWRIAISCGTAAAAVLTAVWCDLLHVAMEHPTYCQSTPSSS
jgi:hypothetical protein